MNLAVSYLDYETADVLAREPFSFSKSQITELYAGILAQEGVCGAVLLSTCNRTELYLSLEDGAKVNPFLLLCHAAGIPADTVPYQTRVGEEAAWHLFAVASGAKSQIWGEDQILAQVKDAICAAREANASDSILEVLFRQAISGAKRVKTELGFQDVRDGTAERAVKWLEERQCQTILVIGNGMIGRHAATLLCKQGKHVTMTLRHYRHGENIIPQGVHTVDYDRRYEQMEACDAVISATASPHHTVQLQALKKLSHCPCCFVDLAMPRDIEPEISSLPGVQCKNIDELSRQEVEQNRVQLWREMEPILKRYVNDFKRWYHFKTKMPNMAGSSQ